MSGATAPARDSSQADLIGPGDSCVPDEPRSPANIGAGWAKSEGSVVSIDNAAEGLDDAVDACGDQAPTFFQGGDALVGGFQLVLEAVALLLERADTRVWCAGSPGRCRLLRATCRTLNLFLCPLSHEPIRTPLRRPSNPSLLNGFRLDCSA